MRPEDDQDLPDPQVPAGLRDALAALGGGLETSPETDEAVLRAAEFVTPDDIKTVTKAVVTHRLILSPDASLEGVRGDDVVDAILTQVPVPKD